MDIGLHSSNSIVSAFTVSFVHSGVCLVCGRVRSNKSKCFLINYNNCYKLSFKYYQTEIRKPIPPILFFI